MKQIACAITDPLGLRARRVCMLVSAANAYADTMVTVTKGGNTIKATQLMKLMALAVKQGDMVIVTAIGPAEDEAIVAMRKSFAESL